MSEYEFLKLYRDLLREDQNFINELIMLVGSGNINDEELSSMIREKMNVYKVSNKKEE